MDYYKFLKISKITLIPNYLLIFSLNSLLNLEVIYNFCTSISSSYYRKIQLKFYNQFSFISYNPHACQKLQTKLKKFKDCRRCICSKFVIIYKIENNKKVKILNIFNSRSNYLK